MLHQLPDLSRLLESAPAKVEPQNCNLITPVRLGDAVSGLSPLFHPAMGRVPVAFEPMGLGGATGRGAEPSSVAQRSAPLRSGSAAIGVFSRCQIAQSTVRPGVVVVVLPGRQHGSGLGERGEQRLVEQFVAQPAVEALDEGVLGRLAGRDVVPLDPYLLATSAAPPCRSARCRCRRRTSPADRARR